MHRVYRSVCKTRRTERLTSMTRACRAVWKFYDQIWKRVVRFRNIVALKKQKKEKLYIFSSIHNFGNRIIHFRNFYMFLNEFTVQVMRSERHQSKKRSLSPLILSNFEKPENFISFRIIQPSRCVEKSELQVLRENWAKVRERGGGGRKSLGKFIGTCREGTFLRYETSTGKPSAGV